MSGRRHTSLPPSPRSCDLGESAGSLEHLPTSSRYPQSAHYMLPRNQRLRDRILEVWTANQGYSPKKGHQRLAACQGSGALSPQAFPFCPGF